MNNAELTDKFLQEQLGLEEGESNPFFLFLDSHHGHPMTATHASGMHVASYPIFGDTLRYISCAIANHSQRKGQSMELANTGILISFRERP